MEQHLEMDASPLRRSLRDAIDDTHAVYRLAGAAIRLVDAPAGAQPGWAPDSLAEMLRDFATTLYDDLAEEGSIPSGPLEPSVRIPTTEGIVEITFPTSARGLFESLLEALRGPTALAA